MESFAMVRVWEVVWLALRCLLCLPDDWHPLLHSRRLQQAAREWRAAGPHNTPVGRLREGLAAAGWLAPPRDPLQECGVPLGGGWTDTLQWLHSPGSYLSCLERAVQQAKQEHLAFQANLLLAVACAGSVTVLAALLAVCGCLLVRLARRPQQQQQQPAEATREVVPPGEAPGGEAQPMSCPEKPAPPSSNDVASPVAVMARECPLLVQAAQGQEPPGRDTSPTDEGGASPPHEAGAFGPSSQDQGRETPASKEEPCQPPPVQEPPLEAAPVVRRCLYVPPRFLERLEGPNGTNLENLGLQFGVLVFTNPKNKKLQIRGAKQAVLDCYGVVRARLAAWQAQDPPSGGGGVTRSSCCRRAGHGL